MTTIFLAKKLLSFQASKVQLAKIRLLKSCNMREMAETKKSLRKINKGGVIKHCRLCLRLAETNIFFNRAGMNFAQDIKDILNVEVRQNDEKPQYICAECVQTLRKAVELKQVAEVTQWRLALEAEMVSESACNDNVADSNHDDEVIIIDELDAPECEECQKIPKINNDCKLCKENVKKPKRGKFGRGPFICETCGLELKTMWRLKTHMLVHTNNFNYSCGYCPYRTRSSSSLQIHERTHTGDRPYQCVQCHATFSSASNLASHRRSHLPPVFSCDFCQRGFKFKQSLLNHIATQHRSAKPFTCSQCENSFATRKMLFCHERKVHDRPRMRQGATPSYIKLQENFDAVSPEES